MVLCEEYKMATTKTTTTARKQAGTAAKTRGGENRSTSKKPGADASTDDTFAARTGRTIKSKPYTSAAIATGAVAAVAAAAAGAYLLTRKDKSFKEASDDLVGKVKEGIANASDTVKDFSQRGSDYLKGNAGGGASDTRSQREIAEEALTLKEMGASNPLDDLSATEIKTGAIAY
jgi:hypothetical protein